MTSGPWACGSLGRRSVSHNPASWLKSTSLSKARPHAASQQVASQSPNTYHKIQSSGMFQASALEKSREERRGVFTTRGWWWGLSTMQAALGCRDLGVLLNVAATQGPPGLPCLSCLDQSWPESRLHRHQGETALGYHWPNTEGKTNTKAEQASLLAAGNNYRVIGPAV